MSIYSFISITIVTYTVPWYNVKNIILKKILESKPAIINRKLAMRSKSFNLAVREWKWLEGNPVSMVPKEKDVLVRVYTNIKNMKLGEDLDKFIADAGGLSTFFNNKYQETFCMNSNVIYIIDEAQSGKYFHRKYNDVNFTLSRRDR